MFVEPLAAFIDIAPIDVACMLLACDAAIEPMCAMLIEFSVAEAASAKRNAAASSAAASISVRLARLLAVVVTVMSSLAVRTVAIALADRRERPNAGSATSGRRLSMRCLGGVRLRRGAIPT
jgi:hypothetical protein